MAEIKLFSLIEGVKECNSSEVMTLQSTMYMQ